MPIREGFKLLHKMKKQLGHIPREVAVQFFVKQLVPRYFPGQMSQVERIELKKAILPWTLKVSSNRRTLFFPKPSTKLTIKIGIINDIEKFYVSLFSKIARHNLSHSNLPLSRLARTPDQYAEIYSEMTEAYLDQMAELLFVLKAINPTVRASERQRSFLSMFAKERIASILRIMTCPWCTQTPFVRHRASDVDRFLGLSDGKELSEMIYALFFQKWIGDPLFRVYFFVPISIYLITMGEDYFFGEGELIEKDIDDWREHYSGVPTHVYATQRIMTRIEEIAGDDLDMLIKLRGDFYEAKGIMIGMRELERQLATLPQSQDTVETRRQLENGLAGRTRFLNGLSGELESRGFKEFRKLLKKTLREKPEQPVP